MTTHACVKTFPIRDWQKSLEGDSDDAIVSWIKAARGSKDLLTSSYYRAYYRLCRRELARRGVGR